MRAPSSGSRRSARCCRGRVLPPAKAGTPRQATRLWICSSSTRPPKKPSWASSCRRASSGDGVQIFVATNASVRRSPSARPRTASARPYIGEESTSRVPAAKAATTSSLAPPSPPPPGRKPARCRGPRPAGRFRSSRTRDAPCQTSKTACYVPRHGGRRASRRARALARADRREVGRRELPLASVLAPRAARPHLRAIYGFARLVDNLGDEARATGSPSSTRSPPSSPPATTARRERRSCGGSSEPSAPATSSRSRSPADRCEPHRSGADALRDVGGRPGVLHVLGRAGRPPRARRLRRGGQARARRNVRRRVHGAPARELPSGSPAGSRSRALLPAARGPPSLRRARAGACGPALGQARHPAPLRKRPCGGSAPTRIAPRRQPSAGGGVAPSPCSHGAGSLLSLRSSAPGGTSSMGGPHREQGDLRVAVDAPRARPAVSRRRCLRGVHADHPARGAQLRLGDHAPAAAEAARAQRPLRVRAPGRRHRGRARGVDGRAARRAGDRARTSRGRALPRTSAEDPVMPRARRRGCSLPGAEGSPPLELLDGALWDVDRTRYPHVG